MDDARTCLICKESHFLKYGFAEGEGVIFCAKCIHMAMKAHYRKKYTNHLPKEKSRAYYDAQEGRPDPPKTQTEEEGRGVLPWKPKTAPRKKKRRRPARNPESKLGTTFPHAYFRVSDIEAFRSVGILIEEED